MNTSEEPVLRLHGRAGLLSAVPGLLGFHPTRSLVLLCAQQPKRIICPVMRVDLDVPEGTAGYLAEQADQAGAAAVAVIAYTDLDEHPSLLDQLVAELELLHIPIMDALIVRDGMVRPAFPDDDDPDIARPVPGPDDPQVEAMLALSAWSGRAVLPDRQAVADSIRGPRGRRATTVMARWLALAQREMPLDDVSGGRVRATADQLRAGGTDLDDHQLDQLLRLSLLTLDATSQLRLVIQVLADSRTWTPILCHWVAALPDEPAAPLCAVLAAAAHHCGDGALAQVALDRTLKGDPGHGLALLLLNLISSGCRPDQLAELIHQIDGGARWHRAG